MGLPDQMIAVKDFWPLINNPIPGCTEDLSSIYLLASLLEVTWTMTCNESLYMEYNQTLWYHSHFNDSIDYGSEMHIFDNGNTLGHTTTDNSATNEFEFSALSSSDGARWD